MSQHGITAAAAQGSKGKGRKEGKRFKVNWVDAQKEEGKQLQQTTTTTTRAETQRRLSKKREKEKIQFQLAAYKVTFQFGNISGKYAERIDIALSKKLVL